MKKQKESNLNTYLVIIVVIAVAIGLYFMLSGTKAPMPKAEQQKQVTVLLLGTDCEECFNISVAVDFVKQQKNINLKEVKEIKLEEAKETAQKYNITKLPAVVITGEISNLTIPNFNKAEDALIFDMTPPPYYDVETGEIKGKITLIVLEDSECKECFNMSLITAQLEQAGISIAEKKTVEYKGEEGTKLVEKYKIEKIPTLLLSKDALDYEVVQQVWEQVGTQESDGMLVLRMVSPPYINVNTGEIEGFVNMINIVDEKCTDCYNISVFRNIVEESFGMSIKTEETLDVSTNKARILMKKYSIELVPTVVLSKEADSYPNFAEAWKAIGTEEQDGSFVFREVSLLKNYFDQQNQPFAYKNMTSGKVIKETEEEAEIAEAEPEE
ncbi:hypothetical protein KY319_00980 [Candidatus Woesearchaeota archaeon]|nr:hypothetical protein [Candidatus Woesearchaeota archaeon]